MLEFGLIWTSFITFMFISYLANPDGELDYFQIVTFLVFESFGLYMLIRGLKGIIKNKETEKNGLECYGIIRDIIETGVFSDSDYEYKILIDFINPETNQVEAIEEIARLKRDKYSINSYVLCKHFQNDINIKELLSEEQTPDHVKNRLIPIPINQIDVELSPNGEYATINGKKYKRI